MTSATGNRKYALYASEFKQQIYKEYVRMQDEDPVYLEEKTPDGIPTWFVTRYSDAEAVLGDHRRFVKRERASRLPELATRLPGLAESELLYRRHLLNLDPPDHTRLRGLVGRGFAARRIEEMRSRVQQIADRLIATVGPLGAMDLIDDYAFPLPITAIAELLGVPAGDRDRFRRWSTAFVSPDAARAEGGSHAKLMAEFTEYLDIVFEMRRKEPREDLISVLVQPDEKGERLGQSELSSTVILLIVAGHETTVNLIGNGTLALIQNAGELERLRETPALMSSAIEELLRHDSPVERASLRWASEDVSLRGKPILRGDRVVVVIGAANRDPRRFKDPDKLDLGRGGAHLAFGHGVHYCLGAALARLEGAIALRTLFSRLPNLRLRYGEQGLRWRNVALFHALERLPLEWDSSSF